MWLISASSTIARCQRSGSRDKLPAEVRERPCYCAAQPPDETPAAAFVISQAAVEVPYLARYERGTGSPTLSNDRPMSLPPNGEGLTERDRKPPRLTAHSFRPVEGCAAPHEGSPSSAAKRASANFWTNCPENLVAPILWSAFSLHRYRWKQP